MRAGQLFDKLDVYQEAKSVSAFGDIVSTRTIRYQGVRCKVLHMGTPSAGASEFTDDMQRVGEIKIEFLCRYLANLEFSDIIIYNGGEFDVYSILPVGRREAVRIRARRRDNVSDSNPI